MNLQPYLLGISYLLTSEVSLSIWVFAVVNQALRVAASAWGVPRDDAWAIHGEMGQLRRALHRRHTDLRGLAGLERDGGTSGTCSGAAWG